MSWTPLQVQFSSVHHHLFCLGRCVRGCSSEKQNAKKKKRAILFYFLRVRVERVVAAVRVKRGSSSSSKHWNWKRKVKVEFTSCRDAPVDGNVGSSSSFTSAHHLTQLAGHLGYLTCALQPKPRKLQQNENWRRSDYQKNWQANRQQESTTSNSLVCSPP